jgi:hypothetical protein
MFLPRCGICGGADGHWRIKAVAPESQFDGYGLQMVIGAGGLRAMSVPKGSCRYIAMSCPQHAS